MRSSGGWTTCGTASALKFPPFAPIDRSSRMHRIRLQPSGLSFQVAGDTDLLLAAAESGIQVPAACRNGVCEICEALLVSGQALNTRNQKLITVGERLMMCRTLALTDLKD